MFRCLEDEDDTEKKMRRYEVEETMRNGLLRASQRACFKDGDQCFQVCRDTKEAENC